MKFVLIILCLSLGLEAKSSLDHASIAVYAVHIPTGKVIIDENSQKSLATASCMKLVTTAAALHLLGPKMSFQTHLSYDGTIEDGVLRGNLYIVGGGDPCLGSDRISSSFSWQKQVEIWTASVKKLGIRQIEGKVFGDASQWEKALAAPAWSWEDLGNYYGVGASALSFHENSYSLIFKPGEQVGEKANILRMEPMLSALMLNNEVKTGPEGSGDRICIYGSEFSFVQHIRGSVPAGVSEFAVRGMIPDPALLCSELLENSLKKQRIVIEGQQLPKKEKRVFHITSSPPVEEIVEWTNQKSINLYAEHLLKKMGETVEGEGSTASGIRSVKKFLKDRKIDLSGMYIADGSGLSRTNLMTAEQLVSLLVSMKKSEHFSIFFNSLPEVKPGIRAKSGGMSLVASYAGYADDVAFAIIINQAIDPQSVKEKFDDFFAFISKKSASFK